jgi:hypothetical protein
VKDNNNKHKDNIYLSFSEVLFLMAMKESNDRQVRFIGKMRFYFSDIDDMFLIYLNLKMNMIVYLKHFSLRWISMHTSGA